MSSLFSLFDLFIIFYAILISIVSYKFLQPLLLRCKEVVMATVRAIFDIVDTSTNQVSACQISWFLGKVNLPLPFPHHPSLKLITFWITGCFSPNISHLIIISNWYKSPWITEFCFSEIIRNVVFFLWYKSPQELLVEHLLFLLFQVSTDANHRMNVFRHHFLSHSGSRSYTRSWTKELTLDPSATWMMEKGLTWEFARDQVKIVMWQRNQKVYGTQQ